MLKEKNVDPISEIPNLLVEGCQILLKVLMVLIFNTIAMVMDILKQFQQVTISRK